MRLSRPKGVSKALKGMYISLLRSSKSAGTFSAKTRFPGTLTVRLGTWLSSGLRGREFKADAEMTLIRGIRVWLVFSRRIAKT